MNQKNNDFTYIYELIDPRDNLPKYIGKTIDLNKRFKGHIFEAKRGDKGLKNIWIRKLLKLNLLPIIKKIDLVKSEQSNYYEILYIKQYKENGFILKNMTIGGTGGATMIGRKRSKESIKKLVETRRKNGTYNFTEEHKRNLSKHLKTIWLGKHLSNKHKETLKNSNGTKIIQLDLNYNIINIFPSFHEAKRKTNINNQKISNAIKTNKLCDGYNWMLYSEYLKLDKTELEKII